MQWLTYFENNLEEVLQAKQEHSTSVLFNKQPDFFFSGYSRGLKNLYCINVTLKQWHLFVVV